MGRWVPGRLRKGWEVGAWVKEGVHGRLRKAVQDHAVIDVLKGAGRRGGGWVRGR